MNDPTQPTPVSRTGISAASVPSGPNPFAVHSDPSQHDRGGQQAEDPQKRRLRWTRLTDLHLDPKATEILVRGVDLHAHLVRIGRRLPVRAIRGTARATSRGARAVGSGLASLGQSLRPTRTDAEEVRPS